MGKKETVREILSEFRSQHFSTASYEADLVLLYERRLNSAYADKLGGLKIPKYSIRDTSFSKGIQIDSRNHAIEEAQKLLRSK